MDSNVVGILLNFVSAAEKSRKYLKSTAYNIKSALKLIEPTLTDEEKTSLDLIEKNINQIFHSYYQKNQTELSAGSLETYKSRVKKVIEEYKKHGTNPSAMANWNPTLKTRKHQLNRIKNSSETTPKEIEPVQSTPLNQKPLNYENMDKFELNVRDNAKILILTPTDINKSEVKKMRGYIDYLDTIAKE